MAIQIYLFILNHEQMGRLREKLSRGSQTELINELLELQNFVTLGVHYKFMNIGVQIEKVVKLR